VLKRTNKRFRTEIFRFGGITNQAIAMRKDALLMHLHQRFKRDHIASFRSG
jgi:hypothetical protein